MHHVRLNTIAAAAATKTVEATVLPGEGFATPWRSFTHVGIPPRGQYDALIEGECEVGYVVLEGVVRYEATAAAAAAGAAGAVDTAAMGPVEIGAPGVLVAGVAAAHRLTNAGAGRARVLALSVDLSPEDAARNTAARNTAPTQTDTAGNPPGISVSGLSANGVRAGAASPTPRVQAVDAARLTWREAIHGGSGRIATRHLWRPEDFASSWTFIDHAILGEGGSVGYHYHDALEESFVVLSGAGRMTVQDETFEVGPGSVTFQGIGEGHGIYNPGAEDLAFLRLAVGVPGEAFTTIDLGDDLRGRRPGKALQ